MTMRNAVLLLGSVLALAACGSTPAHREWEATDGSATLAFDECDEQVDTTMRLRGYPVNPLPETPQFSYRKEIFAQCMRRKGYVTE